MGFDIHKYDKTRFSNNELTNKRIKALLLWFEYEVDKNNLPIELQIVLLEEWLEKLLNEEYYEVLPFFQKKLNDMNGKLTDNLSENIEKPLKEPFLIRVKSKINKWYRLIFKKK